MSFPLMITCTFVESFSRGWSNFRSSIYGHLKTNLFLLFTVMKYISFLTHFLISLCLIGNSEMCKVDVQVSLERSNFVHNDRLLAYINERSKKENNVDLSIDLYLEILNNLIPFLFLCLYKIRCNKKCKWMIRFCLFLKTQNIVYCFSIIWRYFNVNLRWQFWNNSHLSSHELVHIRLSIFCN